VLGAWRVLTYDAYQPYQLLLLVGCGERAAGGETPSARAKYLLQLSVVPVQLPHPASPPPSSAVPSATGLSPQSAAPAGKRGRACAACVLSLHPAAPPEKRLVVPVCGWSDSYDPKNRGRSRVLQLYSRRTLTDSQIKKGSPKHLYLPSPLTGIRNEQVLKASSEVILCEALIDAMTFWCAGYRNVVAAFGVNGFTAGHLAVLRYHGVQRVLIVFDRDAAGDRGAEAVATQLAEAGIGAWQVRFPQGLDANAYALKSGSPEAALEQAVSCCCILARARGGYGAGRKKDITGVPRTMFRPTKGMEYWNKQ
jgi:hypothetical protein